MSTKIYNGFMLNGVYTIQDMYNFVNSLRGPIKEAVYMDRAKEILSTATLIYDMYHVMGEDYFNPNEDERVPLLVASKRHVVLPKDESSNYDVAIGHVDGYTLGMFFFDDRQSEQIILNHPAVTYFGYWDNTDPDDNTNEREWELRKELWGKLFEDSGYPSEVMFVQRILNNQYIMPEDTHMADSLPSLTERRDAVIRNVSFALAKKDAKDNILDGEKDDEASSLNFSDILSRAKDKHSVAKQAVPVEKFTENLTLATLSKNIPENKKEKEEQDDDESDGVSDSSSED